MKTMKILTLVTLTLIACGDNKDRPDAQTRRDGPGPDAQCSNCPAAPTLGTQIDRMARPAINTLLTKGFEGNPTTKGTAQDAYNADGNAAGWVTANAVEFMKNLGIVDSLDTGFCGNAKCETGETNATCVADCPTAAQVGAGNGCGNQVLYNGGTGTTPMATSYQTLAGILAADELYLDTSKTTCAFYLAVEFGVATGAGNTTCGGRAPQYDVIDFSLSATAIGIAGFSTDGTFTPKLKDNAPAHTDYLSTFPYLGVPHVCGDGTCDDGETMTSCAADCP